MNQTYIPLGKHKQRNWYLIDANQKGLGRLSTKIAILLQGKLEATYTPGIDSKIYLVIINAEKISLSGKKLKQKFYYSHSGKPGELKRRSLSSFLFKFPARVLELSVKRMLPNGFAKSNLAKRLRVYSGSTHPHQGQKPKKIF